MTSQQKRTQVGQITTQIDALCDEIRELPDGQSKADRVAEVRNLDSARRMIEADLKAGGEGAGPAPVNSRGRAFAGRECGR